MDLCNGESGETLGAFYDEPLSESERDNSRLGFLLARFMEEDEGDRAYNAAREAFGARTHHLAQGDQSDAAIMLARELGVSIHVLRRMWFCYLKGYDSPNVTRHSQRSSWADCPNSVLIQRTQLVRLAESLPTKVEELLFKSPWVEEMQSVEDCAQLVAELGDAVERLSSALRSKSNDYGEKIAPLEHGRPLSGLNTTWERNLYGYVLWRLDGSAKSERVRSLFINSAERLENPQDKVKASQRAHVSLSRVRGWLKQVEEGQPRRRRPTVQTAPASPRQVPEDERFRASLLEQSRDSNYWDWLER